ncbi:CheR family methyltransferase [Pseudoroseomonas cervicalis]|uniref:CheR family methyltransferase n=1 Tax=Teichococcus cervicalis TaxID=204525 RepID=UPI002780AF42|nr:CheR family methyltransferase [Pseudoroseomonas cervicalis]MDQ1079354.1 chemotaxis protein methyltransferase CheR [Pseudoroseomonas cervicalis]
MPCAGAGLAARPGGGDPPRGGAAATDSGPAAAPDPARFDAARDGLAALVGLAASEVLCGRLRRAAPLIAAAPAASLAAPGLDDPFWAALIDAVTVQETRLFRTAPQLLALAALAFPALAVPGRPLRILSAGCATGEEAWSLAALAAEAGLPARILGLDLCRPALARAASGWFEPGPPDPLREVPEAYRGHFPTGPDGAPRARPGDAVAVGFARANLCALAPVDPSPGAPPETSEQDIILCRNVLIYLTQAAREAVLRGLCARLAPGGALLLGATDLPPSGLGLALWDAAQPSLWRRA